MQTFLIALGAFLFIMTIMAIGVIMGRKPIAGSCGGIGAALGEEDYTCEICGGDPAKCDEQSADDGANARSSGEFYDATASAKSGST